MSSVARATVRGIVIRPDSHGATGREAYLVETVGEAAGVVLEKDGSDGRMQEHTIRSL